MKTLRVSGLEGLCILTSVWLGGCGTNAPTTAERPSQPSAAAVVAQQIPIPTTAAQVPGPAAGTAMTKEYVQMVGRMAYMWGWPLVNNAHRHAAISQAPEPGL